MSAHFTRYQQQHPGVTVGYCAVGSSAGIAAFSAGQVDFGASDVVYNLSLPACARLHLTGLVLGRLGNGADHWG